MATPPEKTGPTGARKRGDGKRDNKEIVRLVVFGIALVLLIAFVIGNSASVRVDFVVFHTHASLIWVILISALLGVLVDRLVIALGRRRKKRT
jgi:uncharacterized integral membrane protein